MKRHEGPQPRQTRIVATIGLCHDTDYPTFLTRLAEAGADILRLNMSHSDKDYAKEREILAWANQPMVNHTAPTVAVMADLQGPKTRIGRVENDGLELIAGRQVALVPEGAPWELEGAAPLPVIPIPEPLGQSILTALRQLAHKQPHLRPSVLFGDGDIIVEIIGLAEHHARGIVVAGGVLGSRKGITIREIDLDLDPFPDKDQRDLDFALEQHVDFVALSFVKTGADLRRVRAFMDERSPEPPRLIAKIETLSAIEHIDDILEACDGIMIARGDLGLQLGVEEVPLVQKQLVQAARRHGKPSIVATQMLESMIANPAPTRAEATDVFNAIVDGGDAVMLSGETSVGLRPYAVVATMDRIARKAETYIEQPEQRARERRMAPPLDATGHLQRINEQFAVTAVQFAENLPARAIVCFTRTGKTPERISRHRPAAPILAFCATERVARTSLLYYGMHPVLLKGYEAERQKLDIMIGTARKIMRESYGMSRGDAMVVTAGINWPKGGTNALQVLIEDHAEVSPALASGGATAGEA